MGGAALLRAQDWQTATALADVDFSGLSPARKTLALKALRTQACSCGCDMKVAECRVKDPKCTYSKGLASITVAAIKAGKSADEAIAESGRPSSAPGPRRNCSTIRCPFPPWVRP